MRTPLALSLAALLLTGCAKFPASGATGDYTRLTFRYTMNGTIDPSYLYIVAIRPLTAEQFAVQDGYGPIPVVTTGSGANNGFVDGRPTRFVVYAPGQSPELYYVKRFGTRTPTSDNPNPIDLNAISIKGEVVTNSGIDPTNPSTPNMFGFAITTQDLVDNNADAKLIVGMDFNILSMNKAATNTTDIGDRVMDALGNQTDPNQLQTFNDFHRVRLDVSGTFSSALSSDTEQARDEFGRTHLPAVDLIDWSLDVNPQ